MKKTVISYREQVKYKLLSQISKTDSGLCVLLNSLRWENEHKTIRVVCSDCNLGVVASWRSQSNKYDVSFDELSEESIKNKYANALDLRQFNKRVSDLIVKENVLITSHQIVFKFDSYSLREHDYLFTLDKLDWNDLSHLAINFKSGTIHIPKNVSMYELLHARGNQREKLKGNYIPFIYDNHQVKKLLRLECNGPVDEKKIEKIKELFNYAGLKGNPSTNEWTTGWLIRSLVDVFK